MKLIPKKPTFFPYPVEAQELADLLTLKGIPVCILNACQSGKQVKEGETREYGDEEIKETSLGSRLMTAGMQMVVAMGYSVTVSAAKIVMEQLYRHLFDNKNINEAIRLGRRELFMQKGRQAYFNKTIDLEDWLLPVIYTNKAVNFNLREFTPQEEEEYFASVSSKFRFSQPEYGFIGRDLEILKVEKALLRHNILLLQGMGGTGKTTLLNYLREWWQITNFTKDVFYFGYDQKAWTLTQILFEIAKSVYDRFELGRFQAMNQVVQLQKLVAKLRAESYVIILDNFESLIGQQLAIQNTLPEHERNQIQDFLTRLLGGKTYIVLGSRSSEEWLQATTFKQNIYQLQGLDNESRTVLAEKILECNVPVTRIPEIREDEDFQRLMQVLAGYPLAMEVVLGNLKKQSPQEILASLQAADVNLDRVSEDKTKSILKCVEYSHSNLSAEVQKLLLCLAPFSGFILRDARDYIEELQKLEAFHDYVFDKFDEAIQEAINWGLLSPDSEVPILLTIQPVFPYFLKAKLEATSDNNYKALQEGFKNFYKSVSVNLRNLMISQDIQKREWGILFCKLEYENLFKSLQICLEYNENIDIFFCLYDYFNLIPDYYGALRLAEFVCQALEKYALSLWEQELSNQRLLALERLANSYRETKQYQQAIKIFQQLLDSYQTITNEEDGHKKLLCASIYHHLGNIYLELHQLAEAKSYFQMARQIFIQFDDYYKQALIYHNLGTVYQESRNFEEALRNYQIALQTLIKFGYRYS
ncbi:MAG: tetratricopeptide repeat protein, partial [Rhizonema sp. PD38]|nr:tetratricopeptide repeat protein [Rhizonema sp. PD38]